MVSSVAWQAVADAIEEALAVAPAAVRRGKAGGMPMDSALRRERTDVFLQVLARQGYEVGERGPAHQQREPSTP